MEIDSMKRNQKGRGNRKSGLGRVLHIRYNGRVRSHWEGGIWVKIKWGQERMQWIYVGKYVSGREKSKSKVLQWGQLTRLQNCKITV